MKLLILICLMASALALPRHHLKNAARYQNQHQDTSEEQQEFVNKQKYLMLNEVTMDDTTEEQAVASAQQEDSSSSSSEETENAIPTISEAKHISSEDILNQCSLFKQDQRKRQIKCNQLCQQAILAQVRFFFSLNLNYFIFLEFYENINFMSNNMLKGEFFFHSKLYRPSKLPWPR
ncbi:alpha-S1-casein-like isoform X2 [Sigmodon hispidus]